MTESQKIFDFNTIILKCYIILIIILFWNNLNAFSGMVSKQLINTIPIQSPSADILFKTQVYLASVLIMLSILDSPLARHSKS